MDDARHYELAAHNAMKMMQRMWDELEKYEKHFADGLRGRPWGFMLWNFGRACVLENKTRTLQAYLIEKHGKWERRQ